MDAAFSAAAQHFGKNYHLDIVVNNAGYSLSGDTEAATEEETHQEMETLFFGTARVTTRAIAVMRQDESHRGGVIFNISSLAGLCAFPGHAYYHAGKFAVEGFTESVAREMHPDWNSKLSSSSGSHPVFSSRFPYIRPILLHEVMALTADISLITSYIVNFCIIEPSGVKTNFEGHSKAAIKPHPAYAADDMPSRKLETYVNKGIKSGVGLQEPRNIAEAIFNIASRGERIPLRVPLGAVAWTMAKSKFESLLKDFDEVKELSFMG